MAKKEDLIDWLVEALKTHNGKATIIQVCEFVWDKYENELRSSGSLFYTWQYDIRWAATHLRKNNIMRSAKVSPTGLWELIERD